MPELEQTLTLSRIVPSGDVVYLEAMGQPIIVLNSMKAITDLMVKKSALLSGRPYLAMLGDL